MPYTRLRFTQGITTNPVNGDWNRLVLADDPPPLQSVKRYDLESIWRQNRKQYVCGGQLPRDVMQHSSPSPLEIHRARGGLQSGPPPEFFPYCLLR